MSAPDWLLHICMLTSRDGLRCVHQADALQPLSQSLREGSTSHPVKKVPEHIWVPAGALQSHDRLLFLVFFFAAILLLNLCITMQLGIHLKHGIRARRKEREMMCA